MPMISAPSHKPLNSVQMASTNCSRVATEKHASALAALAPIVAAFTALCSLAMAPAPAAARNTPMAIEHGVSCVAPSTDWAKLTWCAGREPAVAKAADKRLDQYYTRPNIAAHCYAIFLKHFDPANFLLVEPSAGAGSFSSLFPQGSLAFDVDPKFPGIEKADFLTVTVKSDRPVAMIGNPPFGRNSSLAIAFFNRAATQADVIAFILPKTFRKEATLRKLDRNFHLLEEDELPAHAFLFRSKPYNVPTVFQIWVRRPEERDLLQGKRSHPDFVFTKPDKADFAIQRIGARAGRVHYNLGASPKSHYFIKGKVEAIMAKLDLASVAANTAGNPSLAKTEIVRLYSDWIEASARSAQSACPL